jgi:hypothetical protein
MAITALEIEAIFRIEDLATPAFRKIAEEFSRRMTDTTRTIKILSGIPLAGADRARGRSVD